MKITACPNCGSRKIYQGRLKEGVITGYTPTKYVCRTCGYNGNPIIFDSVDEYNNFLDCFKSDKKVNPTQKTEYLSERDKEVIEYLKDTKDNKFESSKIFKNSFLWFGIIILVVSIWIASRGGILSLYGISLLFVGMILVIIGLINPRGKIPIDKSSKPIFGGIFLMMAGVLGFITWADFTVLIDSRLSDPLFLNQFGMNVPIEFLESIFIICGVVGILFSILSIAGGIIAIKRKAWILCIFCGILGVLVVGPLFSSSILSLIGIVFISSSKRLFKR
jgi:transcription elongation factor Elf1